MLTDSGFGRKKKKEEADLDITPMIDVVFLLLIFFMVTSTMQATPDRDIPPATSGTNANASGFFDIVVLAPVSAGSEAEVKIDESLVSLEQLRAELIQKSAGPPLKVMIYAERDVPSGTVSEVEGIIGEVASEQEIEIEMKFAVRDRK